MAPVSLPCLRRPMTAAFRGKSRSVIGRATVVDEVLRKYANHNHSDENNNSLAEVVH